MGGGFGVYVNRCTCICIHPPAKRKRTLRGTYTIPYIALQRHNLHTASSRPLRSADRLDLLVSRARIATAQHRAFPIPISYSCLLYTSDAADERSSVDLGG